MNHLIAITGGIGSGKSVVSTLLRVKGYTVYDCDERAKWVMSHDELLREQLISLFGNGTYNQDGSLNKPYLAARIFGNDEALKQMNACVHPAVARDLLAQPKGHEVMFYESAILYESGFYRLAIPDEVWTVSAPLELRISRAMNRDHASRDKVLNRINAQMKQEEKEQLADHVIHNDDRHSLIEQVSLLLRK